jgi:hypothetical protein
MGNELTKGGKVSGVGCLVLFSLPFAGVGTGVILWAMSGLMTWSLAQQWEEVPAYIVEADLRVHSGEDGATYEATATYHYTYAGQSYTGHRVAIDGGADNIGDFQERAAGILAKHAQSGEPFRCYVNPALPEKAVLFREFRPMLFAFKLILGLIFASVGFGILIGGIFGARREREVRSLESEHPGEPWRWRPDWESGVIKSSNKMAMIGALLFAGLWNGVCFPILFVLPWGDVRDEPIMLVMLLFPVIGVGAAIFAIRAAIRWFKFGESTFQMASVPGVIGGSLDGLIRIPAYIRPQEGFAVSLRNQRKHTTGSGKNRKTTTTTLWTAELTVPPEEVLMDREQSAIPIHFTIPSNKQQTDMAIPDNKYLWELSVTAEVPGVDFHAEFEVPVFHTLASREITDDEAVHVHTRGDLSVEEQLAAAGVDVMQTPQGVRFVFGMGRAWGGGLLMVVLGGIFVASGIGVGMAGAPLIFPILFPLVGGLILLGGLSLLFGRTVVTIGPLGLDCHTTVLGLGRNKHVAPDEVKDLTHRVGMTVNEKNYYDVYLERNQGGSLRIGRTFSSESQAVAYKAVVLAALGL